MDLAVQKDNLIGDTNLTKTRLKTNKKTHTI